MKKKNQSNSKIIQIGNPTLGVTFNDLFGPNGSVIDNFGPKERYVSFLQEIYPEDKITYIEYIDLQLDDHFLVCKCFDDKGHFISYVILYRNKLKFFNGRSLLNTADFIINQYEKDKTCNETPKVYILSIIFRDVDLSYVPIYQDSYDSINFTFIEIPKILEEGTNSKWLQILCTGATKTDLVLIDGSKFQGEVYQSGLKLLESYALDKNYRKVQVSSNDELEYEEYNNKKYEKGRQMVITKGMIQINCNRINQVLYLAARFPIEKIPEMIELDTDLVNFIISTALFLDNLKAQDLSDKTLEEYMKNFINITE